MSAALPLLTFAEERCAPRDVLIERNLRLVHSVARRYAYRPADVDDLASAGVVGLIRAAEKFEPERGFRFSTYATWWIRQAVQREATGSHGPIRVPCHAVESLRRKFRAGQEPETPCEVAAARASAVARIDACPSIAESMADRRAERPPEATVDVEVREAVAHAIERLLSPREAEVVRLRFGFVGGSQLSLRAVCEKLGVSPERARQLLLRAIGKLRAGAPELEGV